MFKFNLSGLNQLDTGIDDPSIIAGAFSRGDLGKRGIDPERGTIGPARSHRLDDIGDPENARLVDDGVAG